MAFDKGNIGAYPDGGSNEWTSGRQGDGEGYPLETKAGYEGCGQE